jgi:dTDP-4-dehydrorhamnose reductase
MKTILVTGSNGLLGQKIIYALRNRSDVKCISTSKGENRMKAKDGYEYVSMDISDLNSVENVFQKYTPDVVINTAAMTNVDLCESNRDEAWLLNVQSVEHIISVCKKHNTHLVHLSTDFVFDGRKGPYIETDEPNPLSFYAHTKYEGEKLITASGIDAAILRTIIIYGVVDDNSRSNVVLWVLNSLKNNKPITVINDQFRSPTLAEDLADACVSAALKKATGIYHVSGREVMNILDIAEIVADYFELDKSLIIPTSSADLKQPAVRPPVTGFIINKAVNELDFHPRSFVDGLSYLKNQLLLVAEKN